MASIVRPSAFALKQTAGVLRTPVSSTQAPLALSTIVKPVQLRQKDNLMGVAGFHASSRKDILPAEPQVIHGTTNDPAPVPPTSPTHGSYHWTFERLIAAGLIPLTIAPFAGGALNPVMDSVFCGTLLIHSYVGFQSCIIDYFPGRRVPKTHTSLFWLLRLATLSAAVGLYEFETNDIGLTGAVAKIWTA